MPKFSLRQEKTRQTIPELSTRPNRNHCNKPNRIESRQSVFNLTVGSTRRSLMKRTLLWMLGTILLFGVLVAARTIGAPASGVPQSESKPAADVVMVEP